MNITFDFETGSESIDGRVEYRCLIYNGASLSKTYHIKIDMFINNKRVSTIDIPIKNLFEIITYIPESVR